MTKNMNWGINWTASVVALGAGVGQMGVPSAQVVTLNQNSPAALGMVIVSTTGSTPNQTELNTAATTVGTNMGLAIAQALAQIQGWNSGNP